MFNQVNSFGNGLSIIKVLHGISRSLGIAKQFIPLYTEIKPLIAKIHPIIKHLRDLNGEIINRSSFVHSNIKEANYSDVQEKSNTNSPIFFQ